jgi:peptide/nickel transport system substrate-binding protein
MPKPKISTGLLCAVALILASLAIGCSTRAEPTPTPTQAPPTAGSPAPTQVAPTEPGPTLQAAARPAPEPVQQVEEVVFIEEPDYDKALGRIEAGEMHLYAFGTSDPERERRIQESPVMDNYVSYGSYTELSFNVVGPTFPQTDKLNPFHVPAIREAMNWLVDRDHIVEEIYGGLAVPRYLPLNTTFPDYARLSDVARALEVRYAHNPEQARSVITTEMQKLGATMQNGRWHYEGEPVRLIFLIRTEDERRDVGDYIATLLEDIGFTVDRQYKTAAEASPIWIGGDPGDGQWHLYTGGWISVAINRDQAGNFNFFYTSRGRPEPLWQAYTPVPEFDEAAETLGRRDYPTWEDRQRLMARALELAMQDSARIWLVDTISVWPRRKEVNLAADLAGGVSASGLWPYTLGFTGEGPAGPGPSTGSGQAVSEDQRVTFGTPSILTEPWNPVAGTNWIYDLMITRATNENATLSDPFTGLYWPQRVKRAEVYVEEGMPVTRTHDWVELNFVPSIEVPEDAWIDWNAEEDRFITVGEQHPEGLTARTRTVVHYQDDLFSTEWHDGSKLSLGDMVVGYILSFDRAKPESPIFDEAEVPSLETFLRHYRGLRIVQEDPLVVEVYSDQIFPDAETIAASRSAYLFTSTPWPSLALGILAEQNRELAFSSSKSDQLEVEWMSYIAGPSLPILERYNSQAQQEGFIPYENAAGQYISEAQARERHRLLGDWYQSKGHFWVGQGPYYLDSVHTTEKIVVARRFANHPDQPDKWQRFTTPRIPEVEVSGPTRVIAGKAAQFQVEVTFEGEPYPVEDIDFARFLLLDARGELITVADAQSARDGMWEVTLTPEQTTGLTTGSSRLEVVVVSRLVSIPTFDQFSFVAIGQ